MVGIAEISAGFSSLKTLKDIVQGLSAANLQVSINEIKIDLQGHILEARQALFAAQEAQAASSARIAQLEQEIVRLKDWSAERERYELVGVRGGSFAYMLKQGMDGGQPAHWLCANCFNHGQKSILQNKGLKRQGSGEEVYECDVCKGGFTVMARIRPVYPWASA